MCDARLRDGSRVNVVLPPLALEGPCMTIRKFSRETQFEQRKLWDEKTAKATEELKAKGVQFVPADKPAFFKATQPVRDKYGAKYAALLQRILDTK